MTPSAVAKLVTSWREAIVKLKAGVEDSPSYDLKRMIKERSEAFTICADELEAALRQGQAGVSALGDEQRHLAVSALRHYRTACSQSGTAFADNIDSTIMSLLAT